METPPMVASANDVELLRLTSEGDEAAYDELVARHRSALLAFATELANEQATADDLTDAGFDALRERAGEAELIGAVRPFLLMTAADLSGADFDLTAECRGWDPLDAASQATLWHVDIEGDPVETVALVSGVPVGEVPSVVEAARTAVGVPNGGDEALRARLTAYLLGPTASALAAAHAPAPSSTPAAAPITATPEATDEAEAETEAEVAVEAEPDAEPPAAEDDPAAEVDDDATGEVPVISEPVTAEAPAEVDDTEDETETTVADETTPAAEVDDDATGEVSAIEEPAAAEVPVDEPEEAADETREVPIVIPAPAEPPAAMVAPPPILPPMPAAEEPARGVPTEHAAFVRPAPPSPAEPAMEPAKADSGPGVAPYAALDNEDTGPVPMIRPAKPVTYGSRTLTTVLAPVTAVLVVLLAVSLAGAAVLRDEPEAEFQPSKQGSTSKVDRNRPQETVPGQMLRKKKHKKKPSESPSATESESPSESPSGTPTDPSSGLPSPSDGTSPDPSSGPPSPTRPTNTTPPEPTNTTGPTGSPTPTDTGTPTTTPTGTPTGP